MKIAYFINQYPKVSHSFIRREILALERQGFEVLRIALRGWDAPLPDAEDQSERIKTRYVLRRGLWMPLLSLFAIGLRSPARLIAALHLAMKMAHRSDRRWPYHMIYVVEACKVTAWVREFGARHLHAHFGTNSTEVAMLAHVLGSFPYSFTVHGTDEFIGSTGLEEKVRRAAFVAAVSSFVRSQIYMRTSHQLWRKVHVVHCGLERSFYAGHAAPVGTSRRLICVGRLCEVKGQLLLVEAAARLAADHEEFELVLAGDGPLRSEIETLISNKGLSEHIRITGWISSEQVREEILAARALILSSFSEGLPVVIMEAMALHRPVLATFVAGIPELVRHGENGWLFPAGSVDDTVSAMKECLNMPRENLQSMGDAAHERVIMRHSVDIEGAKLLRLFRTSMLPIMEAHFPPPNPSDSQ